MIKIFTTEKCAYCPMVKKLYDHKGIAYTTLEAKGEEYMKLASLYGAHVPLIYNTETQKGMTGYDISRLIELAK